MLRGGSLEEGERPLDIRRGTPFGNPYLVTRGIGRAVGAYAALREADDGGEGDVWGVAMEWGCEVVASQTRVSAAARAAAELWLGELVARGERVALVCGCSGLCHGDVVLARVVQRGTGWEGGVSPVALEEAQWAPLEGGCRISV